MGTPTRTPDPDLGVDDILITKDIYMNITVDVRKGHSSTIQALRACNLH